MKLSRLTALFLAIISCLVIPSFASQLDDGIAEYDKHNYEAALKILRPLAEQGNAVAQHRLGFMYSNGHGVTKDLGEALKWYRKAADQGLAKSQYNLGYIYAKGEGVQRDDLEAAKWYRRSAGQGNHMAQYAISYIYAKGVGLPQNLVIAYKWSELAALNASDKQTRDGYIKTRDSLAAEMTPAEISEAQKIAREWKPKLETPK